MPERDKPAKVTTVKIVPSGQPSQTDRFAELSEPERVPLRLLAEGHTVKSAATLLDTTPSAINERLREARKKTGIGSSREIARQLKAQENRDTKIGIEPNGNRPASRSQMNTHPWRSRIGIFIMLIFAASLALGAYALLSQQAADRISAPSSQTSFTDPLVGDIAQFDMAAAHAKLRSEPEDAQWGPKTENLLRSQFEKIPHVGGRDSPLHIKCASTLCEVAGVIDAPLPDKNDRHPEDGPVNQSMQQIQSKLLVDYFKAHGLNTLGGTFGITKDKREFFFFYYERIRG
ncbi:hypothetical protein GRI58_14070 [Porphyrobacter algicida]|uniref:HTH luxR-type domain-containing protein n=1 Tax=Qipengyuania algicida TaxID=1836209 RepID=A0A845AJY8_9SPHN|nr:hypothetical protein [Qipengyuania algicida]MXP29934.1 hypothetical protein [Qipengyuania algicida]